MTIVREHLKGLRKEVKKMKTFKEILIAQLEKIGKYEIDELTPNTLTVWDKIDRTPLHYKFDEQGNLKDIF